MGGGLVNGKGANKWEEGGLQVGGPYNRKFTVF